MTNLTLNEITTRTLVASTPKAIEQALDDTAKLAGRKLWRGMLTVAASGFGKGLLLTAGLIIAGGAIASGFGMWGAAGKLFVDGLALGAGQAVHFLFQSLGGFAALGIGGALGAAMDVRREQNKISADIAQAQAVAYEMMRTRQQAMEVQQQRGTDISAAPETVLPMNFAAREAGRRDIVQQTVSK